MQWNRSEQRDFYPYSQFGNSSESLALQDQMQRGQMMQQMAMQPTGVSGWQMAIPALGMLLGMSQERKARRGLAEYQEHERNESSLRRKMIAELLTGGDRQGAASQMLMDPQFAEAGMKLLTEQAKPQQVPDALWSRFTPESIATYMQTQDPAVLSPSESMEAGKLPIGYERGDDGRARLMPGLEDWASDRSARARTPGTVVTINPATGQPVEPLTAPTRNDTQRELVSLNSQAVELRGMADSFADEYLTAAGSVANKYRELADWSGILPLGERGKAKLRAQTEFRNRADRMYLAFRRWATGSAASNQEDERIRNSIFNLDQSPEQFKASIRAFADDIQKKLALHQSLVEAGIPLREVQSVFRDTPLLQSINPNVLPSSDAQVVGRELSQQVESTRATAPNARPSKPSLQEFLRAAREDNPDVPEPELIAYYNQTYR